MSERLYHSAESVTVFSVAITTILEPNDQLTTEKTSVVESRPHAARPLLASKPNSSDTIERGR